MPIGMLELAEPMRDDADGAVPAGPRSVPRSTSPSLRAWAVMLWPGSSSVVSSHSVSRPALLGEP